ncbi:zinc finger MYM-type protein 1-like, partial [Aphis craccivora]
PTVTSTERTFSKLKLIKNYLRRTISQTRLGGLEMISIKNEPTKKLNLSLLVKTFFQHCIAKENHFHCKYKISIIVIVIKL